MNDVPATCCGDHCHGCGCGCRTCSCRNKPIPDRSNREAYGNEGGPDHNHSIPAPGAALPGPSFEAATSISTVNSAFFNGEDFPNSFEVQDSLHHRLTDNNLAQHNTRPNDAVSNPRNGYAPSNSSEEPEDIFSLFLSPPDDLDRLSPAADSSMALSGYEASFARQSVTASQLLRGAGDGFEEQQRREERCKRA